jgi:hypothetical protein
MEKSKYTTNSEIDRVFDVFDTFNKDAEDIKLSSANDSTLPNIPVLTMFYTLPMLPKEYGQCSNAY